MFNTKNTYTTKVVKMQVMQVIKTSTNRYYILGNVTDALKEADIYDPRFINLDPSRKNLIAFEVKMGKSKNADGIWVNRSIVTEGQDVYSGKASEKICTDDTIDVLIKIDGYKGTIKYFLPVTDTISHHGIDVCHYWKSDNGKLTVISHVAIDKSPIFIKQ